MAPCPPEAGLHVRITMLPLVEDRNGNLVWAGGYGVTSRGPMRLLGNDVGPPYCIWAKLDKRLFSLLMAKKKVT